MNYMCAWYLQKSEDGTGSPGSAGTDGCELPCGQRELNLESPWPAHESSSARAAISEACRPDSVLSHSLATVPWARGKYLHRRVDKGSFTQVLRSLRQEDQELQASLGYIVSPHFKNSETGATRHGSADETFTVQA